MNTLKINNNDMRKIIDLITLCNSQLLTLLDNQNQSLIEKITKLLSDSDISPTVINATNTPLSSSKIQAAEAFDIAYREIDDTEEVKVAKKYDEDLRKELDFERMEELREKLDEESYWL
jgi:hypothetical protein